MEVPSPLLGTTKSENEKIAVSTGLAINSIFTILSITERDRGIYTFYFRRFLSTIIVDISQVYFTIRTLNVFAGRGIGDDWIIPLGQFSLIVQTLTTAVYWGVIHQYVKFPFSDDPL